MVVRAAGDDAKPVLGYRGGHGFGVGHYLFLVFLEGRLHGFFQADCFRRNRVHQRAALRAGKGQLVQFLGKRRFAEHQPAAWPAMCAMSTKKSAPTDFAALAMRSKSMMRE